MQSSVSLHESAARLKSAESVMSANNSVLRTGTGLGLRRTLDLSLWPSRVSSAEFQVPVADVGRSAR